MFFTEIYHTDQRMQILLSIEFVMVAYRLYPFNFVHTGNFQNKTNLPVISVKSDFWRQTCKNGRQTCILYNRCSSSQTDLCIANQKLYIMKIMEGKVALVTGAASGLGLATAKAFAEAGAAVVLADWNEKAVTSVAQQLAEAGHKTLAVRCDVSDDAQVEAMVKQTVATFGRLDSAYNNAGVQNVL